MASTSTQQHLSSTSENSLDNHPLALGDSPPKRPLSRNVAAEYIPATYNTKRDTIRGQSSSSQIRPNYFDLQRLAAEQAEASLPGNGKDASITLHAAPSSASTISSSSSTISIAAGTDEVEEMEEEEELDEDEIPQWLKSAGGIPSNRRPASRNSIYSTAQKRTNKRNSMAGQRDIGTLSRNDTRSPNSATSLQRRSHTLQNGTFSAYAANVEESDETTDAPSLRSKIRLQYLTSLHLMTDDELDRHVGVPSSTSVRPGASPLQSTSNLGSNSSDSTTSGHVSTSLFANTVATKSSEILRPSSTLERLQVNSGNVPEVGPSRVRHRLVRDLSEQLGSTLEEFEQSTRQSHQERDLLLSRLSAKRKEAEAREEALREILISMGVSKARVDRSLLQATSQAQVPVFKADERETQHSRHDGSREAEEMLPESLREAMLQDIDGSSPDSSLFSTTMKRLPKPVARRLTNTVSGDETPQRAGSPTSSKAGQITASNSTLSTRAAWGSGLVPWMGSGGGGSKKAAASIQATSPAAVEADGYFSDGPGHRTPSPHPPRRSQSRSSSISAVMAQVEAESEDDDDEEHKSRSATKSAFGLLGSLAWRRKKPDRNKTIRQKKTTRNPSQGKLGSESPDTQSSSRKSQGEQDKVDGVSIGSNGTGKSSVGPVPTAAADDDDVDDGERNEGTVRAKALLLRPQAQYTLSGRDVITALYEAIGSAPVSPDTERKQPVFLTSALPKPDHFKAICLATRIMTSDSSSILLDAGKKTSEGIGKMAMILVEGAREQGKSVADTSTAKTNRRLSTMMTSVNQERARVDAKDVRAILPSVAPSSSSTTTAATLSRALGRYKAPSGKVTEPNVTRLPQLFGFGGVQPVLETQSKERKVTKQDVENSSQAETPLVTELEPILAHDVKPPTLSLSARRLPFVRPRLSGRKRQNTLDSLEKVSEDEESSGDEFEVYGGKNLPNGGTLSSAQQSNQKTEVHGDTLLTDRYGFVYDATPADVRLLRRARKEATHAPACLTGIRVGVRARGGTDSQSDDDKDDVDLIGPDSDVEDIFRGQNVPMNGNDSDTASSQRTVSSHKTAGTGNAGTNGSVVLGPLAVTPAKPVAEASTLSAAASLQNSSLPGPTCPIQERIHFEGQETSATIPWKVSNTRRPPSTSQTIKRLLGQLQDMHHEQQAIQQEEWYGFLQRRKAGTRGKSENTAAAASISNVAHQSQPGTSGLSNVVRKGGDAFGIKLKSAGAAFSRIETAAFSEEEWHLGGLVGISQMGTDSKDYQEFSQMIQKGIPLVYRSKIWYECSGAMELYEPGKYQELLLDHEDQENLCTNQIDLDIGRTMPTNIYFAGDGPGVPKLRRLLVAFSWYNPKCGYCQGMNNLAATLLLTHVTEEEAFWVLVSIIEKILPEEYYTSHLLVSQADQRVLMDLMDDVLPNLSNHIRDLGIDLPAVTFAWFLSLYTDCLPVETLFRVWDVMFMEGMIVLFRIAIAIFIINEKELLETTSPSAFYSFVHSMTSHLFSVDRLLKLACEDLKITVRKETIIERREKHVRDLSIELGLDTLATA